MIHPIKYLIDSDTFIQAKSLHYRFSFCESFWEWILLAHQAEIIGTIDKVKKEILRGDDELKVWVNTTPPTSFFYAESYDIAVMKKYAHVMAWSVAHQQYNLTAKAVFADHDRADAFLIATASVYGQIIVSHEASAPASQKSIKIPDAAKAFGVKTITLYELLSRHAHGNFDFKH
jgi:hypothetical protein